MFYTFQIITLFFFLHFSDYKTCVCGYIYTHTCIHTFILRTVYFVFLRFCLQDFFAGLYFFIGHMEKLPRRLLAFHNAVYTINDSVWKCLIIRLRQCWNGAVFLQILFIWCFTSEDDQFSISTAQHRRLREIVQKEKEKNSYRKLQNCMGFWMWKQHV